jgi:hypothetical protein
LLALSREGSGLGGSKWAALTKDKWIGKSSTPVVRATCNEGTMGEISYWVMDENAAISLVTMSSIHPKKVSLCITRLLPANVTAAFRLRDIEGVKRTVSIQIFQ